ncbi:hypothetical protein [Gemmatimonas aurantiaca]
MQHSPEDRRYPAGVFAPGLDVDLQRMAAERGDLELMDLERLYGAC